MARANSARTGEVIDISRRKPFDPWRIFVDIFPIMVREAMDERLKAEELPRQGARKQNHRDFNVACSVMGINAADRDWAIYTRPNTKPRPTVDKVCAETRSLRSAQKAGMVPIIGMIVIGETQADGGTGYEAETLWCCETCRLNHLGTDTEEDTLIATLRPDKPKAQIQTAREMVDFQKDYVQGGEPDEIPAFHYMGEKRWDIVRNRYAQMIPSNFDPLASPENRLEAINAARTSISGYTLVR